MTAIILDLLFLIYAIVYLPVLLLCGKWHGGFVERAGFFSRALRGQLKRGRNIWIHAVSVGEVMAVDGLLRRLQAEYPDKTIVLSVTTKTGYALARSKYSSGIILLHAPLDFTLTVRGFIRMIQPVAYIVAETELWPNLFRELEKKGVPIVVVNGRISDKAYPRYRLAKWFLGSVLGRVRFFCMQSPADAERIIALGALQERVRMVGNIKFDQVPQTTAVISRDENFFGQDMVLLGGSTHPGEEDILLDIFQQLCGAYSSLRLILAPRHPERSAAIAEMVRKRGLEPVLLTEKRSVRRQEQVLIVDTIGQLLRFYAMATVVFVGKSLTVRGGHNIIEPALFEKPILIGPHMQNFRDVARIFIGKGAVMQVEDGRALKKAVQELLDKPHLREELGRKAGDVVRQNCGATEKTLEIIKWALR